MPPNPPQDWAESGRRNALYIRTWGCSYLASNAQTPPAGWNEIWWPKNGLGANLCVELGSFYNIKPLSYFCPVACGCRAGDRHCPDSCPARNGTDYSLLEPRVASYF